MNNVALGHAEEEVINHSCLECLPQKQTAIIRGQKMRLQLVQLLFFVARYFLDALENFYIHKYYDYFDPHVGETACQIRACINAILARERFDQRKILLRLKELKEYKDLIFKLLQKTKLEQSQEKNNQLTIEQFFEKEGIIFYLSPKEKFLFESYFLCKNKKISTDGETYVAYEAIKRELFISTKLSKKIVRNYQLSLADYSTQSVFLWSKETKGAKDRCDLLRDVYQSDDDNRRVLPCYLYTKILIDYLFVKNIPILVISELEGKDGLLPPMYFVPDKEKKKFLLKEEISPDLYSSSCFVIRGETHLKIDEDSFDTYVRTFNKIGIRNIILANMASHPQYSGKSLEKFSKDPYSQLMQLKRKQFVYEQQGELEFMRKFAASSGCCSENRVVFFIKHIYCNTLSRELTSFSLQYTKAVFND